MFRMGKHPKPEKKEEAQATVSPDAAPSAAQPPPQGQSAPQAAPTDASAPPVTSAAPAPPRAEQQTTQRAVTETEAMARDIRAGVMGGYIGKNSSLTGEVTFRGVMRVDGRFSGQISSEEGTLVVSDGARVEANIEVAVARISGSVSGDIHASGRLELGHSARVVGSLHAPSLVIEDGAIFDGNCYMSHADQGRAARRREPETSEIEKAVPPATRADSSADGEAEAQTTSAASEAAGIMAS